MNKKKICLALWRLMIDDQTAEVIPESAQHTFNNMPNIALYKPVVIYEFEKGVPQKIICERYGLNLRRVRHVLGR